MKIVENVEINTRIHELDLTRTAYLTKLDEVMKRTVKSINRKI